MTSTSAPSSRASWRWWLPSRRRNLIDALALAGGLRYIAIAMNTRVSLRLMLVLALLGSFARAAIPDPPTEARTGDRVLADARAEQPLAVMHPQPATPSPSGETSVGLDLRRTMVEQSNLVSARFEQVDAKLYEIVGRLQLLTVCLIALFLGVFVWQISLARQIGALKAQRDTATPSGRLR